MRLFSPTNNFLTSPTIQAQEVVFTNVTDVSMTVSWNRGNGVECIVLISTQSFRNFKDEPVNNTSYSPSSVYGSGNQIGNAFAVYVGTGNTVDITGLTEDTTYYVKVFEANSIGTDKEAYNRLSDTNNPNSQATLDVVFAPTIQASNANFNGDRQIKWDAGDGLRKLVLMKQGSAVDAIPVDSTSYVANKTFGSGDEIGTGNYVVYDGTENSFDLDVNSILNNTTYHFQVFEYNLSVGSPLYITSTATGNPNSRLTIQSETWYLIHDAIAKSPRYAPNVDEISYSASKYYSCSFCETSTEYLLFMVGDNQLNTPDPSDIDQTFLKFKSKSDGLPFHRGWQFYADGNGEPIAVLPFEDSPNEKLTAQQWLATPTVFADNNIVAYYSANGPFNATRYSCGRVSSTDGGRTWTREAVVLPESQNNDYYQFQQCYYDADRTLWVLKSEVYRSLNTTQGRAMNTRIYESTDGAAGLNFTQIADNIYDGTDISVGGFGLEGPLWKVGNRYHWYAEAEPIDDYLGRPNIDNRSIYFWLNKQVVEVSAPISFNEPPIIERVLHEIDHHGSCAIFPGSEKIIHDGKEHIIVNTFLWKLEGRTTDFRQVSIAVNVLTSNQYAGPVVNDNIYPEGMTRFFRMHQPQLDDTYQSTSISPLEVLSETALTTIGSPEQYALGFITPSPDGSVSNYVQGDSWTHDQQYMMVKTRVQKEIRFSPDNVDRNVLEKEGTFKIMLIQSSFLDITLYGQGGGIKRVRMPSTVLNYGTSLYSPDILSMACGFVARLNAGATDIDLTMLVDYEEIPVTVIQNDTFTQIAQNTNPIRFGGGTEAVNYDRPMGSTVVFEGDTHVSTQGWIDENLI